MDITRSDFVLLLLYASYLFCGGYLFHILECPDEIRERTLLAAQKERFLELMEEEKELGGLHKACTLMYYHVVYNETTSDVTGLINQAVQQLIREKDMVRGRETECVTWSLFNSIFFAFTSITTIGYGKDTPTTQLGRGFSVLYTILGIPINTIVITSIADFLRNKVRKLGTGISFQITRSATDTTDA